MLMNHIMYQDLAGILSLSPHQAKTMNSLLSQLFVRHQLFIPSRVKYCFIGVFIGAQYMRRMTRLLANVRIENFVAHLNPSTGQDLVPLTELVPAAREGMEPVKRFHIDLVSHMASQGNHLRGFKVLSANSDVLKSLRASEEVVVPMFTKTCREDESRISISGSRLQHVCCSLSFELCRDIDVHSSLAEVESALDSFYPSIELLGSRFPFYATHLEGFCADLASHAFLIIGNRVDFRRVSASIGNVGLVLLRDNTPVQVGYTNNCVGGPLNAAVAASKYAHALGIKLEKGSLLVCSGLSPRVPVAKGKYEMVCPYGTVVCNAVE